MSIYQDQQSKKPTMAQSKAVQILQAVMPEFSRRKKLWIENMQRVWRHVDEGQEPNRNPQSVLDAFQTVGASLKVPVTTQDLFAASSKEAEYLESIQSGCTAEEFENMNLWSIKYNSDGSVSATKK